MVSGKGNCQAAQLLQQSSLAYSWMGTAQSGGQGGCQVSLVCARICVPGVLSQTNQCLRCCSHGWALLLGAGAHQARGEQLQQAEQGEL